MFSDVRLHLILIMLTARFTSLPQLFLISLVHQFNNPRNNKTIIILFGGEARGREGARYRGRGGAWTKRGGEEERKECEARKVGKCKGNMKEHRGLARERGGGGGSAQHWCIVGP